MQVVTKHAILSCDVILGVFIFLYQHPEGVPALRLNNPVFLSASPRLRVKLFRLPGFSRIFAMVRGFLLLVSWPLNLCLIRVPSVAIALFSG